MLPLSQRQAVCGLDVQDAYAAKFTSATRIGKVVCDSANSTITSRSLPDKGHTLATNNHRQNGNCLITWFSTRSNPLTAYWPDPGVLEVGAKDTAILIARKKNDVQKAGEGCIPQARRQGE
ncbi:hypothetical protein Tco_0277561 [Tanacetum coccineum]